MITLPIVNNLYNIRNHTPNTTNGLYCNNTYSSDIFIKSKYVAFGSTQTISKTDYEYKNKICKASGIEGITPESLISVIGPDELKNLVMEHNDDIDFYTPGYRPKDMLAVPDSYGLENVKSKKFGGNFHIHTVHSDGRLTVMEVLEQAAEYADEYIKTAKTPFTIGITDHNTINGCREAVEILANNPKKFKNLRVILGSEVSTKERSNSYYTFKKPEKYHILSLCVNPFDKDVNEFFTRINEGRTNPMHPIELSINDVVQGLKSQKEVLFSLAHPAYPNLKRRVFETDNLYEVLQNNIRNFKDCTKDKCFYVENYYLGYYDDLATDMKLHNAIREICEELNILKSGGIDTHGNSIFYNGVKALLKK